jgi:hypothetical protein
MGNEKRRWLEVAMEAACEAGRLLTRWLGDSRPIAYKGPGNIVTDADLAAQESILGVIRSAFPDHAILSEEMAPPKIEDGQPLWIVDPLDGTTNYSRRWPSFCVSIAVSQNGRLMAGAVYEPNLDELFHSYRGGGALLVLCDQWARPPCPSATWRLDGLTSTSIPVCAAGTSRRAGLSWRRQGGPSPISGGILGLSNPHSAWELTPSCSRKWWN